MITLFDIEQECSRLSEKVKDNFDCPIEINPKLRRRHGCFIYNIISRSYHIEISKNLMETAVNDEDVIQVVRHEWAHYYTFKYYGEGHGHDEVWRKVALEAGCEDRFAKPTTKIEREPSAFKYKIICPECGFIGGYHRMCKTVKYIQDGLATCKNCHSTVHII